MSQPRTGFGGDQFDGQPLFGVYAGKILRRDDPEKRGRVKVVIPGIVEPESAWALPRTGGARRWGANDVPPQDADVWVQFVNGDVNVPIYEPADHAFDKDGKPEAFPEHEHPDVSVWGRGPFRLVIDNREDQQTATLKIVRVVGENEEAVVWLTFNYDDNSCELYATSALGLHAGGILDIDCDGDVQVKGRKVMPVDRVI
jgi:hypothetical protein